MTWITFTVYLIVGYIAYYAINFLYDLLKNPARLAVEVERLSISDNIETIEVDDDDDYAVVTANHSYKEEKNQLNTNENKSNKEVNKTTDKSEFPIIASTSEAIISPNGGVPLKSLAEIFRQKAIREANQLPFAS